MGALIARMVAADTGCVPSGAPTEGLIAYYPLDGHANDEGAHGLHGAVMGSPQPATDRFGIPNAAMEFSGTGDYIEVADNALLRPQALTIAEWVHSEVTSPQALVSKMAWDPSANEQYALILHDETYGTHGAAKNASGCQNDIRWFRTPNATDVTGAGWHFVVLTYGAEAGASEWGGMRMFVDGEAKDAHSVEGPIDDCAGGGLSLGAKPSRGGPCALASAPSPTDRTRRSVGYPEISPTIARVTSPALTHVTSTHTGVSPPLKSLREAECGLRQPNAAECSRMRHGYPRRR